jgi:hypothetical protein
MCFCHAGERRKFMHEEVAKKLALGLASLCVRNTYLEDIHAWVVPTSQSGDNSDVFVSTLDGNILWSEVSKLAILK